MLGWLQENKIYCKLKKVNNLKGGKWYLNDPYANQRLNAKETKPNEVEDLLRKQRTHN